MSETAPGLSDDHHDWASRFTGIDTRATSNAAGSGADGSVSTTSDAGGAAGFSADAFYASSLQADGYTIGTEPAQDACYAAFARCLSGVPSDGSGDDCLSGLKTCLSAARNKPAADPPPATGPAPATPGDGGTGDGGTGGGTGEGGTGNGSASGTGGTTGAATTGDGGTGSGATSAGDNSGQGSGTQASGDAGSPGTPPPSSAPSGVLRRDTDKQAFWRPNPAPPTWGTASNQPAPDDWVNGFFFFYNLRASADGGTGVCEFNWETTTVDAVVSIADDQAALANYAPSPNAKRIAYAVVAGPPDVISGADPKAEPAESGPTKDVKVPVKVTPPAGMTWDDFLKMLGPTESAQWNAVRSGGGPVPPPGQLNFNLTIKAYAVPGKSSGNLTISWLGEPTFSVVRNSSGPLLSDQTTFNILKAHYDLKILNTALEGSVAEVLQGLFFGGPVQGGVQGQGTVAVGKNITVGVVGAIMHNKDGVNFSFGPIGTVSF